MKRLKMAGIPFAIALSQFAVALMYVVLSATDSGWFLIAAFFWAVAGCFWLWTARNEYKTQLIMAENDRRYEELRKSWGN